MGKLACWFGACLLLATGCDAEAPGMGSGEHLVRGGAAAAGSDPAVVAIGIRPVGCGEALATRCSGTLIAPRVIATAAHCFVRPTPGLVVFFGDDVAGAGLYRRVIEVQSHPDFDDADNANDVALLLLDSPVAVDPAAAAQQPLTSGAVGQQLRVVGFGADGTDQTTTGIKRAGTTQISDVGVDRFTTIPDPALSCEGDSGGPLFDVGGLLVGVTSDGDPACLQIANNSDVGAYYDGFIAPFLDYASTAPTADQPPAVDPAEVCTVSCGQDLDCPAQMICGNSPDGSRCQLPGLAPGIVGDPCSETQDCGQGACVEAALDGTCACYDSCMPPPSSGCECNGGGDPSPWIVVLGFAVRKRNKRRP
jgi:secreted trypsin-like serine protease